MNSAPPAGPASLAARSDNFHRWRSRKDVLAKRIIGLGGLVVIAAVLLILFYLLYVVAPLFLSASMTQTGIGENPDWGKDTSVFLSIEEQQQVALRIGQSGTAEFFSLDGLGVLESTELAENGKTVVAVAGDQANNGLVAVAFEDGRVRLLQHHYKTDFSAGIEQRTIIPSLDFPHGTEARELMPGGGITGLALSDNESELVLASAGTGGRVRIDWSTKQENFLSGEISLERSVKSLDVDFEITAISVSDDHRFLYLGDGAGNIHFFQTAGMQQIQSVQVSDAGISSMNMLLGGISLLAGDANGQVTQLFPVRDEDNQYSLEVIRRFDGQQGPIIPASGHSS